MKWEKGRQGTGYERLTIFSSKRLKCDLHILRYKPGTYIPAHTDKVERHKHYRINVEIKKAKVGGRFVCRRAKRFWRFTYFRPDRDIHAASMVEGGTCYLLSFGWAREF